MRILTIGYGLFPRIEGGAATIQDEMLRAAKRLGMEVTAFQAGQYSLLGRPRLRWHRCDDTQTVSLIDSPNYPGRRNPGEQLINPLIVKLTQEVLDKCRPDLVHIHELTFHTAAVIDIVRAAGIPVVKTIHNFWDLCPERDLLYNGHTPCDDFSRGSRCVDCRSVPVLRPRLAALSTHSRNWPFFHAARRCWHFSQSLMPRLSPSHPRRTSRDGNLPNFENLSRAYEARRYGFLKCLNSLSAIHVYSRRSGDILAMHGIQPDMIRYIPVSTSTIDSLRPRADYAPAKPVVFGYRGGLAPHKGLDTLISAFSRLDQTKASLLIYGSGTPQYERHLKRLSSGLNLRFAGRYSPNQLSQINSSIDIGVVPSKWEEVFGLVGVEFLQCRVPVITSDLGGMKDYVRNGENGLVFRAGNPADLHDVMNRFVQTPSLIRCLQKGCGPWHTTGEMQDRLGTLYTQLLTQPSVVNPPCQTYQT